MKSFAILLLATAVLAAPSAKKTEKEHGKRSLVTGDAAFSTYGLPYNLGGYSSELGLGYGAKILGAGIPLDSSLSSAYASGLEYGGGYKGPIIGSGDLALTSLAQPAVLSGASVLPTLTHPKTERITGVTLHREVQVPVPVPQPVPVEVTKHVPVPHPVPVKYERPYPVPVAQPVPVPITRHVPVKIDRPYPVAVPHPVEVRVPQPVPVPVAQPVPVPVSVTKHVPISVPAVAAVAPTFNVVPSTVGLASAPLYSRASPLFTSAYSSGLSGISSGHEVLELGSSSLGPALSGATLSSGLSSGFGSGFGSGFSSGLSSGVISSGAVVSSGLEHFGAIASEPTLGSSNTLLAPASFGTGIPLKKW
ncbi:zinc finger protein 512B-like [Pseudomyrmex gracilis]|uniref:zinc finger protein 512B-like n=1 Tax=Pseudomyrmex gracilis TaxID=219809 RepID=UPI000994BC48|nr:zinc finger protein 512B-like [Pseudomyrmex gracilis]